MNHPFTRRPAATLNTAHLPPLEKWPTGHITFTFSLVLVSELFDLPLRQKNL